MIDDIEILDLMLDDQGNQPSVYRPGPYWTGYASRIAKAIRSEGLVDFRSSNLIGKGYADTVSLDPFWDIRGRKLRLLKWLTNVSLIRRELISPYLRQTEDYFDRMKQYRNLHYDAAYGEWFDNILEVFELPDTLVGSPPDIIEIRGTTISRVYFEHLMRIYNFSRHVHFESARVLFEIGGGFGAGTHLLLHLFPNIRKCVYLDIPPILYVGTQYLKHFFPSEVIDYRSTRGLEKLSFSDDESREIICVTPWQIERLDVGVDVFWNCASFQEMDLNTVRNYASNIERCMQRSRDATACLLVYGTGDSGRTLSPQQITESFGDSFAFEAFDPVVKEGSSGYLLGTARERSGRKSS